MSSNTIQFSVFIKALIEAIDSNADEVAELDRAIGDGDHVINLQRGLTALANLSDELDTVDWSAALMKVGMTLMSTMGGASGSLFGTLFVSMAKSAKGQELTTEHFSQSFFQGVESVKQRGKADVGEKTMLDTLIPVATCLQQQVSSAGKQQMLDAVCQEAIRGMESTKDLLATKGRASFLGERAIGHIDAGARTSQLMICAIADTLNN